MESFNEEFCGKLEYHLCRTFKNSERDELKGFWCDGISWTPNIDSQLSKKSVNYTRRINTKAWLGTNGQDEYEMTIVFGKHSLRQYAKGSSLLQCIPPEEDMSWFDVNPDERTAVINLM